MSDKTHPPIPPNCEYFEEAERGFFFLGPKPEHSPSIDFLGSQGREQHIGYYRKWKEIVSLVAAEYWQREFERAYYARDDSTATGTDNAVKNKNAWREWGAK